MVTIPETLPKTGEYYRVNRRDGVTIYNMPGPNAQPMVIVGQSSKLPYGMRVKIGRLPIEFYPNPEYMRWVGITWYWREDEPSSYMGGWVIWNPEDFIRDEEWERKVKTEEFIKKIFPFLIAGVVIYLLIKGR